VIGERAVIRLVEGLAQAELRAWVEAGWVRPRRSGNRWIYRDIDVARVRFIHEIRSELNVGDEAVPVVLSLIDQIHGLRGTLRALAEAVQAEPEPVRRSIAVRVSERRRAGTERDR
jgi:chaperone modulatory protein CbpM